METKEKISLLGIIGIGLTTVIGSGIWKDSLLWSNSASIFSLPAVFVAWLLMFCVGLAYAECVSMFPQGGGPYGYVSGAFGRQAGSIVGILYLVGYYFVGSVLCFLTALFGLAAVSFPTLELLTTTNLTVVTCIVAAVFGALGSITRSKDLGLITFVWSIIKIVLIVGVFGFLFAMWTPANIAIPTIDGFQAAVNASIWALLGFEVMLVFAGETKDAENTVPKGILIALPIFLILYLFVSIAASGVVAIDGIPAGTGTVDLLIMLGTMTGIGPNAVFAFGGISAAGTAYALLAVCIKQTRVLADDGVLPKVLTEDKFGIGTAGLLTIIVYVITGGLMVGLSEMVEISVDVVATAGIGLILISAMLPAGITALMLRKTMPAVARPFKTPLYIIVFPLAILLSGYLGILNFSDLSYAIPSAILFIIVIAVAALLVISQTRSNEGEMR